MNLARTIHFDESDTRIFHCHARTGDWAISGGFEFSNWGEADLTGKARQAFANRWLRLETFGRAAFVAVTQIEPEERAALVDALPPNSSSSTAPRTSQPPPRLRKRR